MMRSSTRPPGSTLITSGSASVRSLARNASYLTSFRSGLAAAPVFAMPAIDAFAATGSAPPALQAGPCCPLFQLREYLVGRGEAEIGQHDDDLLLVRAVALVVDDQRRRHQQLLLQPLVRMHPKGAAKAQREVVIGGAARRDRRSGNAGHAVLLPRRRQAVPMNQARLVDPVFDADAKRLADIGGDAERPVRLADAIDRSRLAVDLDIAALQLKDRPRRRIAVWPSRQAGSALAQWMKAGRCRKAPMMTARRDSMANSSGELSCSNSHGSKPLARRPTPHHVSSAGAMEASLTTACILAK